MTRTRISKPLRQMTILLIICFLTISSFAVNTALSLDGSGTQEDPWRIKSLEDFNDFAADPNYWDDYTRLETDVNLAGRVYDRAVIAPDVNNVNNYFDGIAFTGVFDGNDRKIANLTIDDGGIDSFYLGLFGRISSEGEVKNLGLEGGSVSGHLYVGGLVGCNDGNASNCYFTGDIMGDYRNVGGLVGHNYYGSISNCYFTGSVNGGYENTGGLVGYSENGYVSNCYSTADVNGHYTIVGGLVGKNNGNVSNCYSTGDVSGGSSVGGLVGGNSGIGVISNCYSSGSVNGSTIGGLVGSNRASVYYCYSISDVNGGLGVGGLIGDNDGNVSHSYFTGSISGGMFVGGLMGENYSGNVSKCYSTADVTGEFCVGGLVGRNDYGNVSKCYSIGDVNAVNWVGGLMGQNDYGNVSKCYSTGDVDGVDYVGGLMVENNEGSVSNCFWDIENQTHGVTESICYGTVTNVAGLPTSQMQTKSTFTDADWDFINVWNIGENQTYPYLRTYLAGDINKDGIVNFKDFAFVALQWLEECNFGNCPPGVLITYPEDGARLMVGGVPPQTVIWAEANDYDGSVVRVEFFVDDLKLGEDTDGSDGWSYLWQNYSLGFHVLTATAWDNQGLSAMSTPVNVEVWMPDPPPP